MALTGVSVTWYTESTSWSQFKQNIQYNPSTKKAIIRVPYKVRGKGSSYTGGHVYISVRNAIGIDHANLILNKTIKTDDWDKEIQSVEVLDVDPNEVYTVKLFADYTNHVGDHSTGMSSPIEFSFSVNKGIIGNAPPPPPPPADTSLEFGDIECSIDVTNIEGQHAKVTSKAKNKSSTHRGRITLSTSVDDSAGVTQWKKEESFDIAPGQEVTKNYEVMPDAENPNFMGLVLDADYTARTLTYSVEYGAYGNVAREQFHTATQAPPAGGGGGDGGDPDPGPGSSPWTNGIGEKVVSAAIVTAFFGSMLEGLGRKKKQGRKSKS